MKRFDFRLQSLVDLKSVGEFGARELLLKAKAQLESIRGVGCPLKERLKNATEKKEASLQGLVTGSDIRAFDQYIDGLRTKIGVFEEALQSAQKIYDEAVESYRKYQAELKVLKEVRERDLSVHRKREMLEMEQEYIDQMNLRAESPNPLSLRK